MPSVLALDQGTTGSTALVIHQDGSVLGRGYREFTQYFPQPGWVEHDPEEILRVSLEAVADALAAAGERPVGLGITNQRETVVLWDRRTLRPVAPAIVWQDRRTSDRCRELRETGVEAVLRRRTGLVADPYFSATKLEWLLRPTLTGPHLTLILGPGFTGSRPLASPGSASGGPGTTAGDSGGENTDGGSGTTTRKPGAKKAVPDLRPYDPRPC